jgi:hypothetical protein
MAAGLYMINGSLAVSMGLYDVLPGMLVAGLGAGLMMAQGTGVTMMSVSPEQSGAASGLSETMKEVVGQGFAVALAGAILFGTVYSSMTDSYAEIEGITMDAAEKQQVIIALEDTFQEITEAAEQDYIKTLPENTQQRYTEIVMRASEEGVQAAITMTQFMLLVCFGLAMLLPATKLSD